jgi:hypothetical protein
MQDNTLLPFKSQIKSDTNTSGRRKTQKQRVQDGYAKWIPTLANWENSLFITLTFKAPLSEKAVRGHLKRFYKKVVLRHLGVVKLPRKGTRTPLMIYTVERHKAAGHHIHILWSEIGKSMKFKTIGSIWRSCGRFCGYNRTKAPLGADTDKVAGYCAKYCTKDAVCDVIAHYSEIWE